MPRVTHLLFWQHSSLRTTSASYRIHQQYLSLHPVEWPFHRFFLMSIRYLHHVHPSGSISFLLQCPASQQMPFGITVLYDGWSFLSLNYN